MENDKIKMNRSKKVAIAIIVILALFSIYIVIQLSQFEYYPQEKEYFTWVKDSMTKLKAYADNISNEIVNNNIDDVNWFTVSYYCENGIDEITKQKTKNNQFELNDPDSNEIRNEYKYYLDDLENSWYYLNEASECMNHYPIDYSGATTYFEITRQYTSEATDHLNQFTTLLNEFTARLD